MSSYELAQIVEDTFQSDPLGANRILLDFPDGRKWVNRDLVFPLTKVATPLESLPLGTTVSVFTPATPVPGHLDPVEAEQVEGTGFVWHRQGEPEERAIERRADLEATGSDRDSLINEIVEGKKQIQFSYIPTAIESPDQPFIDSKSQGMLDDLANDLRQELASLNMPPIAVACLPIFYRLLDERHPGGIEAVEILGLRFYQRDCLSMPGEVPHDAPFRLFFDEEELAAFLNTTEIKQQNSPPHFSRSITLPPNGFGDDIAQRTDGLLNSMTDKLSDLL